MGKAPLKTRIETTNRINNAALTWYHSHAKPVLDPIFESNPGLYFTLNFAIKENGLRSAPTHGFHDAMDKRQEPTLNGHTTLALTAALPGLIQTASSWVEDIATMTPETLGLVFFTVYVAPYKRNDPRGARTLLHFRIDTVYAIEGANDTELGRKLLSFF